MFINGGQFTEKQNENSQHEIQTWEMGIKVFSIYIFEHHDKPSSSSLASHDISYDRFILLLPYISVI